MAKTIQTKCCSKCKQIRPISEFHKDRNKKDGIQGYCKSCNKQYQKSEKGKAAQKCYRQSEEGKVAHRKGTKKYQKTAKGKATHQMAIKHFNARHPNQIKAQSAVNKTIQDGKLPHPDTLLCHYCPKPAQQYHHWHGYEPEHWLDIVPVCVKCHILQSHKTS